MALSSGAAAAAYRQLVVFGDSLSDTGNAGRFSNGPVWVEHLARELAVDLKPSEMGGTNFAVGGARLDDVSGLHGLRSQTNRFLEARDVPAQTLVVVFGGGNDLLAAVAHPEPRQLVDAAVASLASIVDDLIGRGARDLLVPNLPDVGMTPAVRAYGEEAVAAARQLTARFNSAVDQVLATHAGRPGVRVHRLDVWRLAERVRAAPQEFGFRDIVTPCGAAGACHGYLFWDSVHPTAPAHERLGAAAMQLVGGGAGR